MANYVLDHTGQSVNTKLTKAENIDNKVTSISSNSTDTQYPSAKLLYDQLALKVNNSDIGNAKIYYGTCTTAADVAEKQVVCAAYTATRNPTKGDIVYVTFSYTNNVAPGAVKLKVGNSTVKEIRYQDTTSVTILPDAKYLIANNTYRFTYNGTYWVVMLNYNSNINTLQRTFVSNTNIELPLMGVSGAASATATIPTFSSGTNPNFYTDSYGAIPVTNNLRATINPSTGAITAPGGFIGNATTASAANLITTANALPCYADTAGTFGTSSIYVNNSILGLGRRFYNVLQYVKNSTDNNKIKEVLIKTKIPFSPGICMPKINIQMYNYSSATPTEISIVFNIINSSGVYKFSNCGATSNSTIRPDIYLFSYSEAGDSQKYVGIGLGKTNGQGLSGSYLRFSVDILDFKRDQAADSNFNRVNNWTVETNLDSTILNNSTIQYPVRDSSATTTQITTIDYGALVSYVDQASFAESVRYKIELDGNTEINNFVTSNRLKLGYLLTTSSNPWGFQGILTSLGWSNNNYGFQLLFSLNNNLYYRKKNTSGWQKDSNDNENWNILLTNNNYSSYIDWSGITNKPTNLSGYGITDAQKKHSTLTLTLAATDWSNDVITVTATGVTASNTVIVSPAPTSIEEVANSQVYCSAQGSNSLTFSCLNGSPSENITMNVIILNN